MAISSGKESGYHSLKTLLKFETSAAELHKYFFAKRIALSSLKGSELGSIRVIKLSDGIVYYVDGVYSIGGSNNKIYQVIVTDLEKHGINVIDIKKVGRNEKKLRKELGFYFTTLYDILCDPEKIGNINVEHVETHGIMDMREQIIIENSGVNNG